MKNLLVAFAAACALAGPALAAEDKHVAQHGGIFTEGREADYELVAKPDRLQLYVTDHGKPMDLSKASAKLTLLVGKDKQDVELKPAGNKLEAAGSFKVPAGTKVVAVVANNGKPLGTARFTLK
jgi:hypothetical protein